jgi:hypothetical protein
VDFEKKMHVDPTSESEQLSFVLENGLLKFKQKEKGKTIVSISDWTDAYVIFMATILKRHPSQALHLTKYLSTIRTAARLSWGWKDYDIQFRPKKTNNPNLSWDSVDGELRLMYIVNFQGPKPTSKTTPWDSPHKKNKLVMILILKLIARGAIVAFVEKWAVYL